MSGAGGGTMLIPDEPERHLTLPARWADNTREQFLTALTMTGSVRRSAKEVGFSFESAYRRRRAEPGFAEAWDAAIEIGRERLRGLLIEAATARFDPEALPIGEDSDFPPVSVAEAINIAKLGGRTGGGSAGGAGEATYSAEQIAELQERVATKLERTLANSLRRREQAGWTIIGRHSIPPGWTWTGEGEPRVTEVG